MYTAVFRTFLELREASVGDLPRLLYLRDSLRESCRAL
jgi:hypothetical protein